MSTRGWVTVNVFWLIHKDPEAHLLPYYRRVSEFLIFMYEDPNKIATAIGVRQQADALCPIHI